MVVGNVSQVLHLDRNRGAALVTRLDQQLVGNLALTVSIGCGEADVAQAGLSLGVNLWVNRDLHQLVVRQVARQDHGLQELPLSIRSVGPGCR